MREFLNKYLSQVEAELTGNILPFWMNHVVDKENGGFYNLITNNLEIDKQADKGCILNSRILWTYSAAYRELNEGRFLDTAKRAFEFLQKYFWDYEYSGLYWMTDYTGKVVNGRKQLYNLAFGIYGLSEYYRAGRDKAGLELAVELYRLIEKHGRDNINGGYYEALSRDWQLVSDMRLSTKDMNEKKSMNTHLHILEAYTNLLRVWDDNSLRLSLRALIIDMVTHIVNPDTYQFRLFFDELWGPKSDQVSYGHDIEGSWLLYEAACVLGDGEMTGRVRDIAVRMARSVFEKGMDRNNGGIYNETEDGAVRDTGKPWWTQAEAMVGFMNAYELTGTEEYLKASYGVWEFVRDYLVDKTFGEWFWKVSGDGKPLMDLPKVEPWKCPYHNGRACFEVISRLRGLLQNDKPSV